MKIWLIFTILLVFSEFTFPQGVTELTIKSFNKFVTENEFVLIYYYTKDCPHCDNFTPTYMELSKELHSKKIAVKVGKIDPGNDEEFIVESQISGFPTIRLFNFPRARRYDYEGTKSVQSLVNFVERKILRKIEEIKDIQHLKKLELENDVMVIACGKESMNHGLYYEFNNIILSIEDLPHYFSNDINVKKELKCNTPGKIEIVIVKKFEDKRMNFEYQNFNKTQLYDWIFAYSVPAVNLVENDNLDRLSRSKKFGVILLIENINEEVENTFKEVALKFREIVVFLKGYTNQELVRKLMNYYSITNETLPTLVGIKFEEDENIIDKFKYNQNDLKNESIILWINELLENKIPKYYQSQPIPENPYENGVKVIVGNNFYQEVLNNEKDVLVEFYSDWCAHCKKLFPRYEYLARKLVENKNLVIAKIDFHQNEYKDIELDSFPTIILFKGGQTPQSKLLNKVYYDGDIKVESFISFLNEKTFHKITSVLKLENEEQMNSDEESADNIEQQISNAKPELNSGQQEQLMNKDLGFAELGDMFKDDPNEKIVPRYFPGDEEDDELLNDEDDEKKNEL